MYRIFTVEERIRVPPEKLKMKVRDAVRESIADKFEGLVDPRLGVILSVVSVEKVGEGRIVAGDPGVFYNSTFKLLTFKPELNELTYGEVIDNTEFGSFVRIGPMDGLIHISQIMDDFVSYDSKNAVFLGKETKRTLKEGDKVRARVIAVSFGKEENKIGLTMRQSGLGNILWLEEEKKKAKKGK
ncbi:MAG: DNA-directed RNA polymerase [Candidatus Aenigmarchaeota archaeon]|nr:DNA-directed RNA polymerase [Candidatus Aenigmarchaeota archaeon]